MIIENPYMQPHYLTQFFPLKPKVIDKDRSANGDYYVKPTQFWFLNCEPEDNTVFAPIQRVDRKRIDYVQGKDRARERSMIHPQYAERFIKTYILDKEDGLWLE